jgi:hypothetical protein
MRSAAKVVPTTSPDVEKQLQGFIDKFEPEHQALIRAMRKALRRRMPSANELVSAIKGQAIAQAKTPFPAKGKGKLIVRSISARHEVLRASGKAVW